MAITAGNWSSATDPFLLATAHAYVSLNDTLITNNRLIIEDSEGFLGGFVQDKDVQELYFKNDAAVQEVLNVDSAGFLTANDESFKEFGTLHTFSKSIAPTYPQPIIQPDTKDFYLWLAGISGGLGSSNWSMFAYTAYAWERKDPAQLILSWVAHYVESIWTLKDYLDQTSFQDASDYYDENPCHLSCWREVGLSIGDQIKKVMDHTSDFLVVAPREADGDVKMSLKTRRSGITTRATAIDLESESVKSYTVRPTDRYTIDNLSARYGNTFVPPNWNGYPSATLVMPPVEFFHDERTRAIQKVGTLAADRSVDLEAEYHESRANVLSHLDIGFWKDDQDELEVEFADLSHFNFEAGDIVPVTGKGYDGTELFLVTEKTTDWDTMLASCRLLMLKGLAGKPPRYADDPNILLSVRPNSLGLFFDGSITLPLDVPNVSEVRNFNRLWDEAGHAHPSPHTRGTVGPGAGPPGPLALDADQRERWPGFALGTDTGLEISLDATDGRDSLVSAASHYTFYWVGNPTTASGYRVLFDMTSGGTDNVAFTNGGSGTPGKVQFYDGAWQGTVDAITGWQILVFKMTGISGGIIRRNGAEIEAGLSWTQRAMATSYDYGIGVNAAGTLGVFEGDWAECALFTGAHSTATVDFIEAHLAEKYNITI